MVMNKSIFHPKYLLIETNNPFSDQHTSEYCGDVNSGTWFVNTKETRCSLPNHSLMPFYYFVAGLSFDEYGKLIIDAVLTCYIQFNRKARNQSSTYFTIRLCYVDLFLYVYAQGKYVSVSTTLK